ncbi:MAG TPA: NUDIX domain-containing protein [Pseudonocardiaceae bacterium]|nr:NUDIX domain-containing protein [Pseudonocardiaceae bacterium]
MIETIPVAAPARTVAAALAEPWLLRRGLAPFRVHATVDQLAAGDEVELFRWPVRLRVDQADEHGLLLTGPVRLRATVVPSAIGAQLTCEISLPVPLRMVRALLIAVRDRAEQLAEAPVVVGAAIVAGGLVFTAQRDRPPVAAGRWEFPGGKVEPGEDERVALARECKEELAVDVLVGDRLGPDLVLANGWVLRLYLARLAAGTEPDQLHAGEHRAQRWLAADQLHDVAWLNADRVVLPGLRAALNPDR